MRLRQSSMKMFQECALKYRWAFIDKQPREQSGALSFGTIIHDVVLHLENTRDLESALLRFKQQWSDPTSVDPELKIDYFVRGTNWKKYLDEGQRIIKDWWDLIQWESDEVLAREHHFVVPLGEHELEGTVDKLALRYMPKLNRYAVLVSDYKTTRKAPTYGYLEHDLQFTAYCYATTQPEFWTGIENGADIFQQVADWPRYGEWVQLQGNKRMDAGERTELHYGRLKYAAEAMANSIGLRIFVPTISGTSCLFCDFRRTCGLPDLATEDNDAARRYAD